eukprot:750985-Hanusia_phi.AAC.4
MAQSCSSSTWQRLSGCRIEENVCYKQSEDCCWGVALSEGVTTGRHLWGLKVAGRTGRMSVGVGLQCDEILSTTGGWATNSCEGKVWYYTSTGGLRVGPKTLCDTAVRYGEGDIILMDLDLDRRELRFARGKRAETNNSSNLSASSRSSGKEFQYSIEQLPPVKIDCCETQGDTSFHIGVSMFFEGACCELLKIKNPDAMNMDALKDTWAEYAWTNLPLFKLAASTVDAPVEGPPVPRLSLNVVRDGSGTASGLSKGAGSGMSKDGALSGGREQRDLNEGRLPSPDPHGPLSSRSISFITSPGRHTSSGSTSPGRPSHLSNFGLTSARPSPRPSGSSTLGGGSLARTPRGYVSGPSPQITPRAQASPRLQPSPRGLLSPRAQGASNPSPRLFSPRTPRGAMQPSPRKPEALAATLTLQQHREMETMSKRLEVYETMLNRYLAENNRLRQQLESSKSQPCDPSCEYSNLEHDHGRGESLTSSQTDLDNNESGSGSLQQEENSSGVGSVEEQGQNADSRYEADDENYPVSNHHSAGIAKDDDSQERESAKGETMHSENVAASEVTGELSGMWEVDPAALVRVKCIGRGICGAVWEGKWRHARVAIKDLDISGPEHFQNDYMREMLQAFRCEVSRLCRLRHPNILAFYGAVTKAPKLCIITELMDYDLRHFLRHHGKSANLVKRLEIALGAINGLLYLHSQNPPVVHRDVKPENLLLCQDDEIVKVCDFGLARDKQGAYLQTIHQGGTLNYIAPEVHRGAHVDERCDVYSFAVVLWELLSLSEPYKDKPVQSIPGIVGWGGERPSIDCMSTQLSQEVVP